MIDIGVSTNLNDIFLYSSEIFVKYDTEALGENVIQNGIISVEAINGLTYRYSTTLTDHSTNIFRIAIANNGINNLLPLSSDTENILSVGIDIRILESNSPINMDEFLMSENSYYYDPDIGRPAKFTSIVVPEEETILVNGCYSFFPEELNAGVGDTLTIEPDTTFNFGLKKGWVDLSDAENPNMWAQIDSFYIDWSPNQITVLVPHLTQTKGMPGSGKIRVNYYDSNGDLKQVISKGDLHICYNITNTLCIDSTLDVIEDVKKINSKGGYTFYLGSKLDTMGGGEARKRVDEAICLWADQTGINFTLSDSIILNPDPNTGQNIKSSFNDLNIIFMGDSTSGFSENKFPTAEMIAYSKPAGEIPNFPECVQERALFDMDIIVNNTKSFNYTLSQTDTTQIDFYSTMLHELGHAHSHHHANYPWEITNENQTKTMFWVLPRGQDKRYIDEECAELGSQFILKHSQDLIFFTPPMVAGGCLIDPVAQIENIKSIEVSPNPINSYVDINYSIEHHTNIHVSVYNLSGNIVSSMYKIPSLQGGNRLRIDTFTHLPSGIYFIKLQDETSIKTVKVVKQ